MADTQVSAEVVVTAADPSTAASDDSALGLLTVRVPARLGCLRVRFGQIDGCSRIHPTFQALGVGNIQMQATSHFCVGLVRKPEARPRPLWRRRRNCRWAPSGRDYHAGPPDTPLRPLLI